MRTVVVREVVAGEVVAPEVVAREMDGLLDEVGHHDRGRARLDVEPFKLVLHPADLLDPPSARRPRHLPECGAGLACLWSLLLHFLADSATIVRDPECNADA